MGQRLVSFNGGCPMQPFHPMWWTIRVRICWPLSPQVCEHCDQELQCVTGHHLMKLREVLRFYSLHQICTFLDFQDSI